MSKIYLPMVFKNYRVKPFISTYLERAITDPKRVSYIHPKARVHNGIKWTDNPNWFELEKRRQLLKDFPRSIQIKNSPPWARVYPNYECSPIKPEHYKDFAEFVVEVARRFDPYAIEIWNEPDVYRGDLWEGGDRYIGCFGELGKWIQAGESFGEFTAAIYDLVKGRIRAEIWGGALLLGGVNSWRFAEGLIRRGKMDALSYHSYSAWGDLSGAIKKAERLNQLTDMPLILSETAYQMKAINPQEEKDQAAYFEFTYRRLDSCNVKGMNWYTLADNGWENTDLVWRGYERPSYKTYKRLCDE